MQPGLAAGCGPIGPNATMEPLGRLGRGRHLLAGLNRRLWPQAPRTTPRPQLSALHGPGGPAARHGCFGLALLRNRGKRRGQWRWHLPFFCPSSQHPRPQPVSPQSHRGAILGAIAPQPAHPLPRSRLAIFGPARSSGFKPNPTPAPLFSQGRMGVFSAILPIRRFCGH